MSGTPVLRCSHVLRRFGDVVAVDALDLSVAAGEILCILGPSGCGKTTALRLIAGLDRPDAGTIEVGGEVVASAEAFVPAERRRVGMVFQDWALFPHLDVRANVAFGLDGADGDDSRVEQVLDMVQLGDLGARMPHELSGGQQQRVALARALAPSPRLLLLDEPFSNLDARLRSEVRWEVRELLRTTGTTAVFVTHDQEEAFSMADRIAVMIAGSVRRLGGPYEIYADPADADVARLLGQSNVIPAEVHGATASTPLGELQVAPGLATADATSVLVHAESLSVERDQEGGALVTHVEYYGHDQMVTCVLPDGIRLDARVMGPRPEVRPGTRVRVRVTGPVSALRR